MLCVTFSPGARQAESPQRDPARGAAHLPPPPTHPATRPAATMRIGRTPLVAALFVAVASVGAAEAQVCSPTDLVVLVEGSLFNGADGFDVSPPARQNAAHGKDEDRFGDPTRCVCDAMEARARF